MTQDFFREIAVPSPFSSSLPAFDIVIIIQSCDNEMELYEMKNHLEIIYIDNNDFSKYRLNSS